MVEYLNYIFCHLPLIWLYPDTFLHLALQTWTLTEDLRWTVGRNIFHLLFFIDDV